jgi:hypothetical protein
MKELTTIPYGELAKTKLTIPEGLDIQDWKQIGHRLCQCRESLMFWIGDWINYGEKVYGNKYSEAYQILCQEGGYDPSGIRKIASVTNRLAVRSATLSFGHHVVVAPLGEKDQRNFLSIAETEKLSVRELTERIRAKLKDKAATGESGATAGLWMWENWFSDFDRGFKEFEKRMPLEKWEDGDLTARITTIQAIEQPLIQEAKRRGIEVV